TLRSPRQYNCYCESFVLITPGSLRLVAHGPGRARDLIDRGVDVRREIHGQVVRLGGKQDDIGKDHDTALRWEDARGHVRRSRRDLGLVRITHVRAPGSGHTDPEVPDHADSVATTGDISRGGPISESAAPVDRESCSYAGPYRISYPRSVTLPPPGDTIPKGALS